MPLGETIAAPATPPGESALAVLRASGPLVPALAAAVLNRPAAPPPRQATFGAYHNLAGEPLDQIVLTHFAAPASATGEDLLEITCHGNPLLVRRILDDLFARGCRPAQPGEFTRTAFLNGKLDLSQAEAVADLISARTDSALRAARRQLDGELSHRIQDFSQTVLQVLAEIEAYIDFPEEDLPVENPAAPRPRLAALAADLAQLLATARHGALLRDGATAVIAGPPNAGKSSLLNALLGRPRAIVSPEPGTTRDFLEDRFVADPYSILITDTAGLHSNPSSPIEQEGIRRSLEKIASADLLLIVIDSSQPTPNLPESLTLRANDLNTIIIENKTDLSGSKPVPFILPNSPHIRLSCINGQGLDSLRAAIVRSLQHSASAPTDDLVLTSARQVEILSRAHASLRAALAKLDTPAPAELLSSDLRLALDALGETLGLSSPDGASRLDHEAMLDHLFATFCIGK